MSEEEGVRHINSHEDFIAVLATNQDTLVVIDFYAAWCKPCKMIAPAVERWAKSYGTEVLFYKINVNENCQTAELCKVKSMPTFQLYKGGELVEQVYGAKKDVITAAIDKFK